MYNSFHFIAFETPFSFAADYRMALNKTETYSFNLLGQENIELRQRNVNKKPEVHTLYYNMLRESIYYTFQCMCQSRYVI